MRNFTLVFALAAVFATPALAQPQSTDHAAHHVAQAKSQALTDGEVRRIDKDAKKITLRHGPIQNLDMPGMTMVFQVKDAAMLDKVNVGDKVRFSVENISGTYTVTHVEQVK